MISAATATIRSSAPSTEVSPMRAEVVTTRRSSRSGPALEGWGRDMGESCGRTLRGATFAGVSSFLHSAPGTLASRKGDRMKLQRIVVAVDESDAGRWAARAALDFAAVTGAEVAVLRTILSRPA